MASKVVDRIDPFHNKASIKGRKQKRSQGSSHYRTKGPTELQALPLLRGMQKSKLVSLSSTSVITSHQFYLTGHFLTLLDCS